MDFIVENKGAIEHGGINMEAFMVAFSKEMAKEHQNEVNGRANSKVYYDEIGPREGYTARFRQRLTIERPQNSPFEIIYEFAFDSTGSALQYCIRLVIETSTAVGLLFKMVKKALLKSFDHDILPKLVAYMQAALDAARHDG